MSGRYCWKGGGMDGPVVLLLGYASQPAVVGSGDVVRPLLAVGRLVYPLIVRNSGRPG